MTLHVHTLAGCSPTPLAHYLKALGVLRLVGEQKDKYVRGWWRNETFHLVTSLTRDELETFFLNEYQPTPLITPWNGGSGFYPKDNKSGIEPIERSTAARFAPYREAILAGHALTADRAESPKDEVKQTLQQTCRQTWRGPLLDWLEAALVLTEEGSPVYPALLGTGGNDGRLDFTNNFMQRLNELFDGTSSKGAAQPASRGTLRSSLFAEAVSGLKANSIGQFFPGAAGGANSSIGFAGGALVNPWDFVLMLEGAIVFASALTRRMTTESLPQAAAPFAVYSSASGYASAVDGEKSRGEQWMPLWNRPATHREIVRFIAEGRCQLQETKGTKPRTAQRPLDVARAIARLGVARGVSEFQRYGYIERNGQANLAIPLGRWSVPSQPVADLELIDEIKPWFDQLQRSGNDKNAPAGIGRAARVCENAMLACCRESAGDNARTGAARWQQLFVALGEAEAQLARMPGFTGKNVVKGLQPLGAFINGLSPRWLLAINDRSAELRLALAFAGQHGGTLRTTRQQVRVEIDWNDPVRGHFLPLMDARSGKKWAPRRFAVSGEKLSRDTRVVCSAGDIERDAVALVRRRVIEARQSGGGLLPLLAVEGTEASLVDIAQFLNGELDSAKLLSLARPLMSLDWNEFEGLKSHVHEALDYPTQSDERDAAGTLGLFGLLRLCHFPREVPVPSLAEDRGESRELRTVPVRLDPAIVARLMAGGVQQAVELAIRRLSVSGLRPKLRTALASEFDGRRLVAALAFPISTNSALRLAARLTRPVLPKDDPAPILEDAST